MLRYLEIELPSRLVVCKTRFDLFHNLEPLFLEIRKLVLSKVLINYTRVLVIRETTIGNQFHIVFDFVYS